MKNLLLVLNFDNPCRVKDPVTGRADRDTLDVKDRHTVTQTVPGGVNLDSVERTLVRLWEVVNGALGALLVFIAPIGERGKDVTTAVAEEAASATVNETLCLTVVSAIRAPQVLYLPEQSFAFCQQRRLAFKRP